MIFWGKRFTNRRSSWWRCPFYNWLCILLFRRSFCRALGFLFSAAQPVEAQIANITAGSDGDSKATVTYMIQGKEYETMLTYYSSSMHIGDVITVYIQLTTPKKQR